MHMRIGIEAQRILRIKKHGMDIVAIELIKSLQEIDSNNEYVIFSRKGENNNAIRESDNFQVQTFSSLTYADWEQLKLLKAVNKQKIDLLHCTANTAPFFSSVPIILTIHDIIYLENIDLKGTLYQNLGNLYRRFLVPKIVKKANLILTVSEFEKNNIVKRLNLPEEKVQVLYNGVSSQFNNSYTSQQIQEVRDQYKLPQQYIMFLGNTASKKNTLNVIKAFVDFCLNQKHDIPLVMLDYKKELVVKVLEDLKHPDLADRFVFPGYVPHNQIPLVYNAATVFLYPSLRESFGLPILEAMACGVPVITSSSSSMPEIAGNAALFVDPLSYKDISKAIEKIVTDEKLRSDYIQKGLQRVKSFTWKAAAKKLLSIYETTFG